MQRLDSSIIAGGNVNQYSTLENSWAVFKNKQTKNLSMQLLYNLETSFLGIYPREMKLMFI